MCKARILDRISHGIHESALKFQHQEQVRLVRLAAEGELLQQLADLRERVAENRALRRQARIAA